MAIFRFLKHSIFNGLLILIPLALLLHLIFETLIDLVDLVEPLSDLVPDGIFPEQMERWIIGLMFIVSLSFFIGLQARSRRLSALFAGLEARTLGRLGIYQLLKRLSVSLMGQQGSVDSSLQCALFTLPSGQQQLVYVVEQNRTHATVMQPSAPTGLMGPVTVVDNQQLQPLNVSVADAVLVYNKLGDGYLDLLSRKADSTTGSQAESQD